ncbi:TAXI family TRAP transporter solute-binding subunit (plasmid) [Roseinatronobacter sp. S2]|nr:TAXI family TRAP transporter solute-binding subunit [Roseinatronobacter sp. S2]
MFISASCAFLGTAAPAHETSITIGTGGVTGVYFPASNAICRLLNQDRAAHGIRCKVQPTGGSMHNLQAIRFDGLEFGVVQSDLQFHAYNGSGGFEHDGAFDGLRAVFSLHPEPFTVIARADSGIRVFDDLAGKRVNIGNPGSGQRATMDVVMQAMGWGLDSFAQVTELSPARQSQALCDNDVDAIVYAVGHPSVAIHDATACDTVLVKVDNPAIRALVDKYEYYSMATIAGGMYRGAEDDTPTFGMRATLVASADVPEMVAYQLTRTIFENLDQFRGLHSALNGLDRNEMVHEALSAKMHAGAKSYFQEVGLLE